MIVTEIYNGQGLGNQLACYVTTRVVAKDKGFEFGIKSPEKFKCLDFMDLDFGNSVEGGSIPYEGAPPITLPNGIEHYFRERDVRHPNGSDIRIDDPLLENIQDNTKIDGVFQSENRIIHRKEEIKQWLRIKPEKDCYEFASDDICVLNFRGGEYASVVHFHLPKTYWDHAISRMLEINPNFRFVVITDDVLRASQYFPDFEVYHFDIAKDYFSEDGVHYVNNDEYTNDEIISGYNFHSLLYDEMEHLTPWVTTMYYNDGSIYTNQWAEWTGKSKITGEVQTNNFHCWWKWEGDKIISTACYFDTTDIDKEAALYAEQSQ